MSGKRLQITVVALMLAAGVLSGCGKKESGSSSGSSSPASAPAGTHVSPPVVKMPSTTTGASVAPKVKMPATGTQVPVTPVKPAS